MDKRIAKAAAFKMRCRDASIPEAMRASKFTLAESSNPAKQMAVRRAYEKAIGGKTTAPATFSVSTTSTGSSLSCLSLDGSEGRRGGRPEIVLHDPRFPMTR